MGRINKRVLISYDDICSFQCKHCYTLDIERPVQNRTIDEIVGSIKNEEFDVVYISQRRDNFTNPDAGLKLCRKIFETYRCNIFIITRNILEGIYFKRLLDLNDLMKKNGKELVVACSVFAIDSYTKSENPNIVPHPYKRLEFMKNLSESGVKTIVIIRPVFPDNIIPSLELHMIVDRCSEFETCVVSAGLAVNRNIAWRLGIDYEDLCFLENSSYLEGVLEGELHFVDVRKELQDLKDYCIEKNVSFFEHTMQALNYYQ